MGAGILGHIAFGGRHRDAAVVASALADLLIATGVFSFTVD